MPVEGTFAIAAFGVFFVMWVVLPSKLRARIKDDNE